MKLLDPEYYAFCLHEFERIRQRRNSFVGKPDIYEKIEIALDRIFEAFYKSVLK